MMNKLLFATLTLFTITFHSQAFASKQCVPSASAEAAQAKYDHGIEAANQALSQDYARAAHRYDQANESSMKKHDARIQEIETQYSQEMKEIRAHLDLGWRESLAAATERHNQSLQDSSNDYMSETQDHLNTYNHQISQAQSKYQSCVNAIADDYNSSVCAE